VTRFKVGDHVGVGVYVNSCRDCKYCHEQREIYCEKGLVLTFNGVDKDGTITKGGYSSYIVVHERCIFLQASWFTPPAYGCEMLYADNR
jgi:cinnamyl-alcohol dehydrogenase